MMDKMMNHPMMKKCCNKDLGKLILRVGLGIIFIYHGYDKFQHMDGVIGFFGMLGLPAFVAYAVSAIEFAGGIALVLGVFTGISSALLAIIMLVAIFLAKWSMVGQMGFKAVELEFVLFIVAVAVSMIGAGKYSLMRKMHSGMTCDGCGTCAAGGCTSHEGEMKCDGCNTCKDGCSKHE
jgi:uncharacterized membrane protein YphA (DoxX/SURF4 family)